MTVHTGVSVGEYFANKMASMKAKLASTVVGNQVSTEDGKPNADCDTSRSVETTGAGTLLQYDGNDDHCSDDSIKKRAKKSKKKSKVKVEPELSINDEMLESVTESRKDVKDNDSTYHVESNTDGADAESIVAKKKKRSKSKTVARKNEELERSTDVAVEEAEKPKKVKKNKKDKAEELVISTDAQEEAEKSKKKKNKKRKNENQDEPAEGFEKEKKITSAGSNTIDGGSDENSLTSSAVSKPAKKSKSKSAAVLADVAPAENTTNAQSEIEEDVKQKKAKGKKRSFNDLCQDEDKKKKKKSKVSKLDCSTSDAALDQSSVYQVNSDNSTQGEKTKKKSKSSKKEKTTKKDKRARNQNTDGTDDVSMKTSTLEADAAHELVDAPSTQQITSKPKKGTLQC